MSGLKETEQRVSMIGELLLCFLIYDRFMTDYWQSIIVVFPAPSTPSNTINLPEYSSIEIGHSAGNTELPPIS
ncbi:hypothetical protein D3C76_170170 [compost metagenome]